MAEKNTIKDLLINELKDLYSAEKQLTRALPKMASGSDDTTLKTAFVEHLHETTGHVTRLEETGRLLDIKLAGKRCLGMEGIVKEGAEALAEEGNKKILDLGLIGVASRVEHYESAGYKVAISLAQRLGAHEVVDLLRATLSEEEAADAKLMKIGAELVSHAPVELSRTAA